MREIVFDTETTGLDPLQGHRLVEIGCIELINRFPTGKTFHCYLNPERDMPAAGVRRFTACRSSSSRTSRCSPRRSTNSSRFIGDAPLVAHNAMFDLGFLNAELERAGAAAISRERMIDTLAAGAPQASRRLQPARRSVRALRRSTIRGAPSMARCSMPSFWPRSMSS